MSDSSSSEHAHAAEPYPQLPRAREASRQEDVETEPDVVTTALKLGKR
jgi:hypothetical protein